VLVAGLAGCGVAGDGNLTDDWKQVADAKPVIPPAGVCYDSGVEDGYKVVLGTSPPTECTQSHAAEVYHVGELPGDIASASAPPAAGSAEFQKVFGECEKVAKDFLGDDWYNGRLLLAQSVPLTYQWLGGGRWYRCHLMETKSQSGTVVKRTSSVRDTLKGDRPLANTCFNFIDEKDDSVGDLAAISCDQGHDAEYVGVFEPAGTEPPERGKPRDDVGFAGCRAAVASYLGATGELKVGYLYWGFGKEDWDRGDKKVRCYATAPDGRKLKGSVKGIGNKSPLTD
jgi:hypothetical protein